MYRKIGEKNIPDRVRQTRARQANLKIIFRWYERDWQRDIQGGDCVDYGGGDRKRGAGRKEQVNCLWKNQCERQLNERAYVNAHG